MSEKKEVGRDSSSSGSPTRVSGCRSKKVRKAEFKAAIFDSYTTSQLRSITGSGAIAVGALGRVGGNFVISRNRYLSSFTLRNLTSRYDAQGLTQVIVSLLVAPVTDPSNPATQFVISQGINLVDATEFVFQCTRAAVNLILEPGNGVYLRNEAASQSAVLRDSVAVELIFNRTRLISFGRKKLFPPVDVDRDSSEPSSSSSVAAAPPSSGTAAP